MGAPLVLGNLLGCSGLEVSAHQLGTQLLSGFSWWMGKSSHPLSPLKTPLHHRHLVQKEAPSQGSRGKPETILAPDPTEHCRSVSKCGTV